MHIIYKSVFWMKISLKTTVCEVNTKRFKQREDRDREGGERERGEREREGERGGSV